MNNAQRIGLAIFCFILGGALIIGAYLGANMLTIPGSTRGGLISAKPQIEFLFRDIKLYLGIIAIGAGLFFSLKKYK